MNHPETHIVTTENGPRPAGKPDECFYCKSPVGAPHAADCVCRKRTVVVRMTMEYTIAVPEHWDADGINFHRNESSWCAGNAISELSAIQSRREASEDNNCCPCSETSFEYVREATEHDEERDCLKTLPS